MMEYTFTNGLTVKGTYEQIAAVATSLKLPLDLSKLPFVPGYYKSGSRGLIKVTDMADAHLKNALCKAMRSFYERLSAKKYDTLRTFAKEFEALDLDATLTMLHAELQRRIR